MSVVGSIGVQQLDFVYSCIQFYILLSAYLCCISILYLDLYLLDDALISQASISLGASN